MTLVLNFVMISVGPLSYGPTVSHALIKLIFFITKQRLYRIYARGPKKFEGSLVENRSFTRLL
jgi:hypothetical protein